MTETCPLCGKKATIKIEEEVYKPGLAPHLMRHPMTSYICDEHFMRIFGEWAYAMRKDWEMMVERWENEKDSRLP